MKTSRAAQPVLDEQLLKQLARPAHERQALGVLVDARRLAHEHQVGVGVARAEHDLGAGLVQRAARAGAGPRGTGRRALRVALRPGGPWLQQPRRGHPRAVRARFGKIRVSGILSVSGRYPTREWTAETRPIGIPPPGTGTDMAPNRQSPLRLRISRASPWSGAGRLGTRPVRRAARAGRPSRAPGSRQSAPAGADAILLCVPDGEIRPPRPPWPAAAPPSWATPAAPRRSPRSPPPAARPSACIPLQTFTGAGAPRRFSGAGCAVAGATPAALEFASRSGAAPRDAPLRDRRRGPRRPTTRPPRSPPTSSWPSRPPPSRWRAAPGSSPPRPAPAGAARAHAPWRTGPSWARSGPSPGPWRAATTPPSRASARPWPRSRPAAWPSSTSSWSARARWRPRGAAAVRTLRTVAELRSGARAPSGEPGDDRPGAHDGRLPRRPPRR